MKDVKAACVRLAQLIEELVKPLDRLMEQADDLEVIQVLRSHTPANQQYIVDRFRTTLQELDRLQDAISISSLYEYEEELQYTGLVM
jgi:urate oxidase